MFLRAEEQSETPCFYFGRDIPIDPTFWNIRNWAGRCLYFYCIIVIFSPLSHKCLTKVSRNLPFPTLRVQIMILLMRGTSVMSCRVAQAPEVWLGHGREDAHNSLLDHCTSLASGGHCCHSWFLFPSLWSWSPLNYLPLPQAFQSSENRQHRSFKISWRFPHQSLP